MKPYLSITTVSISMILILGSCSKTRLCECREPGDDSVEVSYSIKEKNKSKADKKCTTYSDIEDNQGKNLTCTIR